MTPTIQEKHSRKMLHPNYPNSNPQDITEPPAASRTPEPDLSRLEHSLRAQHMSQDYSSSSIGDDYGCFPAFLHRRHSSNYQLALSSIRDPSKSQKPEEQVVDDIDTPIISAPHSEKHSAPQLLERQASYDSQSSSHSLEDSKRLMQRGSIDLENARSTDQFNVQYHGTRRDSNELKREEADKRFQKKHPAHLKKYHTNESCEYGHDHPECKRDFCFHSNQTLSQDQIQQANQGPNYPETFEYNDFKRRMSFHD